MWLGTHVSVNCCGDSYGESEAELRKVIPLRDIVAISLSNDRADPKDFLVEVHIVSATLPSNVAPSATVYLELKARSVQEKTPVLKANAPFWNLNVKIPASEADARGGGFTLYMYTAPANSTEYVLAGERFVTYSDLFSEPNFSQEPIPHEITLTSERRQLEVTIVSVKGITGTGTSGNCDVYCKVSGVLRKNGKLAERKTTSVKYKTVSPTFNERIVLGETMAVDDYSAVHVEVWDKHKMVNADSLLGVVYIPLDDFGTQKVQRVYELTPPPEAEAAADGSDLGFMTVTTQLTIIDLADPEVRQRHSQLAVDLPPDGNFGSVSLRIRSTACNEFSTWWPGQTLDEAAPEYFYACAGYDYLVLKEHEQRRHKTSSELEAFCVQVRKPLASLIDASTAHATFHVCDLSCSSQRRRLASRYLRTNAFCRSKAGGRRGFCYQPTGRGSPTSRVICRLLPRYVPACAWLSILIVDVRLMRSFPIPLLTDRSTAGELGRHSLFAGICVAGRLDAGPHLHELRSRRLVVRHRLLAAPLGPREEQQQGHGRQRLHATQEVGAHDAQDRRLSHRFGPAGCCTSPRGRTASWARAFLAFFRREAVEGAVVRERAQSSVQWLECRQSAAHRPETVHG
jgi:hypothetical protein